MIMADQLVRY